MEGSTGEQGDMIRVGELLAGCERPRNRVSDIASATSCIWSDI